MRESELYPTVKKWLEAQQRCFVAKTNTGVRLGRIDAVGLRDTGRDLTGSTELVAVEVKAGNQPFGTAAGQAHGYSVYADRVYLADLRTTPFSADEIEIASHLNIGLLTLKARGRGFAVQEVLTAPRVQPIEARRLEVVGKLGYNACTVCQSMFQRGTEKQPLAYTQRLRRDGRGLARAVEDEKGYVYWLDERDTRSDPNSRWNKYRRYVCSDCVRGLFFDMTPT